MSVSALIWHITQRVAVIPYPRQGPRKMNYHSTMLKIPEERRSHPLRGGNLKSLIRTSFGVSMKNECVSC
jgi:hypothetical protein